MSNVLFEEEKRYVEVPARASFGGMFTTFLKRFGIAKTDKEAEIILITMVLGTIVLSGIIAWASFGGSTEPVEPPPLPPGIQARTLTS